jgi:uncharacterized protein (TIGR03435 family)
MPLRFTIQRAFNVNSNDAIVGLPSWADSNYDIIAKAPSQPNAAPLDNETMAPMILNLLVDRFKLKYHTEDRPMTAYTLVAGKPKMKKADPNSRTSCKTPPPSPGTPPGTRQLICQNVTMAQFAERLLNLGPGLNYPIEDGTKIEGTWDFTLSFTMGAVMAVPRPAEGAGASGAALPAASDPTGGLTIFEAIEKQLGLKLEAQKRNLPVFVIDHIEKATEN